MTLEAELLTSMVPLKLISEHVLHIFCLFWFSANLLVNLPSEAGWPSGALFIYIFICGSDRQPRTTFHSVQAECCSLQETCGIPQGFMLGPLFFTTTTLSVTLTLFLLFIHFLKNFVLITHRRWYLCMLTEIKKAQIYFLAATKRPNGGWSDGACWLQGGLDFLAAGVWEPRLHIPTFTSSNGHQIWNQTEVWAHELV